MKQFNTFLLFILFSIWSSAALAQDESNHKEINTVEQYTKTVDNYLKGLNDQDLELILSLYADNGTVEDPVGSEIVKGIENIRKFYSGAVKLDLELTRVGPVRIAANEAAFPFELVMEVDGQLMKSEIIDVFRFDENGKIVSMRAFWGPSNRRAVEE